MSTKKIFWIYTLIILLIGFGFGYAVGKSNNVANAEASFDHSNCQYPERATNPPNGCDNSDPACSELIKGATSCPADEPKEVQQPITPPVEIPVEPREECGK
jgi:hypothetical protein